MTELNLEQIDLVRVTAACHETFVANPEENAAAAIELLKQHKDSAIIVTSELSLTGYTCGDLFAQETLLSRTEEALQSVAAATTGDQIFVVGLPLRIAGRLYNVAAVLGDGRILGVVPKQHLPNYQEFYEGRWFHAADGSEPPTVALANSDGSVTEVPFGVDLLFRCRRQNAKTDVCIGVELCEDLWMPTAPSSYQALAGANVLLNLSASNELIGKASWRKTLVEAQSGRCLAAYAYASAGPTESTTDVVFGGHCLIAENGQTLANDRIIGDVSEPRTPIESATTDIDLGRLEHDRRKSNSWSDCARRSPRAFRYVEIELGANRAGGNTLRRTIPGTPFVPRVSAELDDRCAEVFGIQCAALEKRVSRLPDSLPLNIGVSGGLDSTLALLVAVKACQQAGWPVSRIAAVTMPGFGTTDKTLASARSLMRLLGVTASEIDIRQLCLDTFHALGHKPFGIEAADTLDEFQSQLSELRQDELSDLTFENVQARQRTMILMSRGFVLGTGDLSEQALGWSTYNGDHMSMYNVNASIPKTLVRFLVRYVAEKEFEGETTQVLLDVVDTPISPELLPASGSEIKQFTEQSLGPYELHDFFLYYMVRFGFGPAKIVSLAQQAEFSRQYETAEIESTLETFLRRFFANQFKRSCVPDGPKVGSVSLSPRGDWRMPSDADADAWLSGLKSIQSRASKSQGK